MGRLYAAADSDMCVPRIGVPCPCHGRKLNEGSFRQGGDVKKRAIGAATVAVIPAGIGLMSNPSLSWRLPVSRPDGRDPGSAPGRVVIPIDESEIPMGTPATGAGAAAGPLAGATPG